MAKKLAKGSYSNLRLSQSIQCHAILLSCRRDYSNPDQSFSSGNMKVDMIWRMTKAKRNERDRARRASELLEQKRGKVRERDRAIGLGQDEMQRESSRERERGESEYY